jgi:hypothetical protein
VGGTGIHCLQLTIRVAMPRAYHIQCALTDSPAHQQQLSWRLGLYPLKPPCFHVLLRFKAQACVFSSNSSAAADMVPEWYLLKPVLEPQCFHALLGLTAVSHFYALPTACVSHLRGYCATGRAMYGLVHQGNCPQGSLTTSPCKRV